MMIVLISVIVAFLYHKITEYVNNRKIDIVIFLSLLISHFIWNYYFLPIEILIEISGANLLLSFLKKLQIK
ncbi:Membrane protein [Streptococcus pneumoniae]|nr:Membrane protein [Streptococcus pneumoniae]